MYKDEFIKDTDWIKTMSDKINTESGDYTLPLGICIGNVYYKISDLTDPEIFKQTRVIQSLFKIVYASRYCAYIAKPFPVCNITNYSVLATINAIDPKTDADMVIIVFEHGEQEIDESSTPFDKELSMWWHILYDYTAEIAEKNRADAIAAYLDN